MKKILSTLLIAVLLLGAFSIGIFAASDTVAYLSTNTGDDNNNGLTASTPKKTFGKTTGSGAASLVKDGGTIVIPGRYAFGSSFTINMKGDVTFTANDGKVDYKNTEPASNPASGSMKLAGDAKLSIACNVTIDDIILFQEAGQNTIVVKSGATLTITEKVVTLTKQKFYMNIEVEEGGTAIINGGTFSKVSGAGKVTVGPGATILENESASATPEIVAPVVERPEKIVGDYAYISSSDGDNEKNSGLAPTAEKKSMGTAEGNGALSLVKNGGTIIVTEKYQLGKYTLKAGGPITITGCDGTTNFKFEYPKTNPGGGSAKLASGATLTLESDLIFDDVILFQEGNQGTIHVKSGATLTVTDLVILMSAKDYHYKVIIDEGAKAILSEDAQKTFTIENNGILETYVSSKTIVKLTIDSTLAFINNKESKLDAAPVIKNGRTMLPIRFVAEALGASVGWDGATSSVTVTTESTKLELKVGTAVAKLNGVEQTLDTASFIENGRTYLPVRFVAESLGATVDWDPATRTATLTK